MDWILYEIEKKEKKEFLVAKISHLFSMKAKNGKSGNGFIWANSGDTFKNKVKYTQPVK